MLSHLLDYPMSQARIRQLGQQHLQGLRSSGAIEPWRAFLANYQPRPEYPDDAYVWLACALALAGVASDNFGVGAVLIDAGGTVVAQEHNQMFHPYFRSDRHAEMVVLESWENSRPLVPWPHVLTLYTSVESCPMCVVRLLQADVRRVLFAARDTEGGMVGRLESLPPAWRKLAQQKTFGQARCSQELVNAADQIFQSNLNELMARLKQA